MNDEKFCDELLDAVEAAGKALGADFYSTWKELDRVIRRLQPFMTRRHDRKTSKRVLMSAIRLNEEQRAQLIGLVHMLPQFLRFTTKGIGQSLTKGTASDLSHEERKAIRDQFEARGEYQAVTESVKSIATRKGIATSTVWKILNEDDKTPEYWEREYRKKMLSCETEAEQKAAREGQ